VLHPSGLRRSRQCEDLLPINNAWQLLRIWDYLFMLAYFPTFPRMPEQKTRQATDYPAMKAIVPAQNRYGGLSRGGGHHWRLPPGYLLSDTKAGIFWPTSPVT